MNLVDKFYPDICKECGQLLSEQDIYDGVCPICGVMLPLDK